MLISPSKSKGAEPEAKGVATQGPPGEVESTVQIQPISIFDEEVGNAIQLKVDAAVRSQGLIIVAGWTTGRHDFALRVDRRVIPFYKMATRRVDVAEHLSLPDGEGLGFVLAARHEGKETIELCWKSANGEIVSVHPLKFTDEADTEAHASDLFKAASGMVAVASRPFTKSWRELIRKVPLAGAPSKSAKGYLEAGAASDISGDSVVVGWEVHTPGTPVWLEDQSGSIFSLKNAYRRFRQDVHDVVDKEFGQANRDSGFIVRIKGGKTGQRVYLKTVSELGVHILAETVLSALPASPVAAAHWLFGIATPISEAARRASLVDKGVLERLIAYRQEAWADLPVRHKFLGRSLAMPKVSVIVPLYGRTDFVEHQLIEFAADPWFLENAELIYVVDDPQIAERFLQEAEALHRIYQVPMSWIWGSVNRGFSGANNLGASVASGKYLLFLNSDAFPRGPGWIQPLLHVLETRPDIGAVGPRLLFADGSLQHAGMEFRRRDELGIWVNHHPYMGLDPSLDPHPELSILPAITGACMALRREDFDSLGGWDTGYLIGDFEDSDLCLKLRNAGFKIAYLPSVELTHLERQSFKLLGESDFRTKVVIYNAVRHQERWKKLIETPFEPSSKDLQRSVA
ncbi:glycosyltransferase family 2 protein [Bordetella sp. 2513F-2]